MRSLIKQISACFKWKAFAINHFNQLKPHSAFCMHLMHITFMVYLHWLFPEGRSFTIYILSICELQWLRFIVYGNDKL